MLSRGPSRLHPHPEITDRAGTVSYWLFVSQFIYPEFAWDSDVEQMSNCVSFLNDTRHRFVFFKHSVENDRPLPHERAV